MTTALLSKTYGHQSLCLPCRLHKLQQKHAQRQKLAQRAQAAAEDEIAWDDDTPGASPAASPQQPAKVERTPADKVSQTFQWLLSSTTMFTACIAV